MGEIDDPKTPEENVVSADNPPAEDQVSDARAAEAAILQAPLKDFQSVSAEANKFIDGFEEDEQSFVCMKDKMAELMELIGKFIAYECDLAGFLGEPGDKIAEYVDTDDIENALYCGPLSSYPEEFLNILSQLDVPHVRELIAKYKNDTDVVYRRLLQDPNINVAFNALVFAMGEATTEQIHDFIKNRWDEILSADLDTGGLNEAHHLIDLITLPNIYVEDAKKIWELLSRDEKIAAFESDEDEDMSWEVIMLAFDSSENDLVIRLAMELIERRGEMSPEIEALYEEVYKMPWNGGDPEGSED